VQVARREWRKKQATLDVTKLVFLDETWVATNMTRRYGRAPVGTRCVAAAPYGHWQTTTFLAGLRHNAIIAPLVVDGPVDGEIFLAWVLQFLCPVLQQGDVVVLDNLSSHKIAGIHQAIVAAGATLLYLPPYSPDLNPIEMLFAKLKALLRKAALRTIDALWTQIGTLLETVPTTECANYFKAAGYSA
jgi:transposase